MQCPHHLFLVDPRDFSFNSQTAASNSFQQKVDIDGAEEKANKEFKTVLRVLEKNNISFTVADSPNGVHVPDAVFPNNWLAVMPAGELILFPMFALNRRAEINEILIDKIKSAFAITRIIDLRSYVSEYCFLEGTGSIVFDHDYKLAYACESPRTNIKLLNRICKEIGYTPVSFLALDLKGEPVYHTNVVMSAGKKHVVICIDAVADMVEKVMLRQTIEKTGKELIEVTYKQMNAFAGNILQVLNTRGEKIWLMSRTAHDSYNNMQISLLESIGSVISMDIPTIETLGGGSLRCMLAGIHAPYK